MKLQLQNCHRGGRFGRSSISTFVKPQAKNEGNKRCRRTSEVTDVDVGSWGSGRCKERVCLTVDGCSAVDSHGSGGFGHAGLLLYGTICSKKSVVSEADTCSKKKRHRSLLIPTYLLRRNKGKGALTYSHRLNHGGLNVRDDERAIIQHIIQVLRI